MRLFRSARWLMLALLVCLIPATSFAGVLISVNIAPPVLPVYEQPICPAPNLMWTPGYWAYGDDGYYWVPGAWVPAPYMGALWTPGYWGWSEGFFIWHRGYWAPHVGYYGGVNYGFGYGGFGFAGGMWRGDRFAYNVEVMHVDNRYIHETYRDHDAVERGYVGRDSHVAFNGGRGGIDYRPRPEEMTAAHEAHVAPTSFQAQHENSFRTDHTAYARFNGGRPQNVVIAHPLGGTTAPHPMNAGQGNAGGRGGRQAGSEPGRVNQNGNANAGRAPQYERPANNANGGNNGRPATPPSRSYTPPPSNHSYTPSPSNPRPAPAPLARPEPAPRPAPAARPEPAARNAPPPANRGGEKPRPEGHEK